VVTLKSLSSENAIELVRSRLDGNDEFVTDDHIKAIYDKSYKNTRRFLENMEDVSRHAVTSGREQVAKEDLAIL
jgi:hypothetical protein